MAGHPSAAGGELAGSPPPVRTGLLRRVVDVRGEEAPALGWSFAYGVALMWSYYMLRPIREEMGIRGGVERLHESFLATFLVMLAAVPAFSALMARVPRARAIPVVYRLVMAVLAGFAVLVWKGVEPALVARAFFVWVSVFNLFVVSVLWSYLADIFTSEQGKRLFGFVAGGLSAGAILGLLTTGLLVRPLGIPGLLLLSAVLLEVAARCAGRLARWARTGSAAAREGEALGGSPFAGFTLVARSPYLLGLAAHQLLVSFTGTIVYLAQARLMAALVADGATRTQLFAAVDLATNLLTLGLQSLATGRLLAGLGLWPALAAHPLLALAGLLALAAWPSLWLVTSLQALRRAVHYSFERPAREVLFTVVSREEKYKAKSFLDTVVYRGGDVLGAQAAAALFGAGVALGGVSLAAAPLALAWLAVARYLRNRHASLERR
jgi:AAA family ATP:ADP antiporter